MTTFTYFAYGSNMLLERVQNRCKSARFAGAAVVHGFDLVFDKKSQDGSGKATITEADNNVPLYGALFEIDTDERKCLTRAEGRGYERKDDFTLRRLDNNAELTVTTYIAQNAQRDHSLTPYGWYKQLVVAGARQTRLPEDYVGKLERIPDIPDRCEDRETRIEALAVLRKFNE